jgi:hypothetical protein
VYACCGVSPTPGHPAYRGETAAAGCTLADHVDVAEGASMPTARTLVYSRARILFSADVDSRNVRRDGEFITIIRSRPATSSDADR